MSTVMARLLSEFDALPPREQLELMQELLRRRPAVDLGARGIDPAGAADLRARLKTFAEDWERPEAAIYDEEPAR